MLDEIECLAYFSLQSSKAATQHGSLHRNNDCNEVIDARIKKSSISSTILDLISWNLCWGPLGLLGQCFLFYLWEPNETVVRPVQLHVIGYVRDCFIGVIKFSVVLLSHQKKGSLAPRTTLQIQEPLYTQKINTETSTATSTATLTATCINAILFALHFGTTKDQARKC